MNQYENREGQEVYIPAVAIPQITACHTRGCVPIALAAKPGCVCGFARRVGYTGTHSNDLAIYRLKIREHVNAKAFMLPLLFVMDGGRFVEYEVWQKNQEKFCN